MSTADEQMKILEMIQEDKISPEQGAQLLNALQVSGDARWLHIRITDHETGQAKVNVRVPMRLVSNALRFLTE